MKKLVAVAMVFAFVAGGAFAISFSGDLLGNVILMQGSSADGDDDITGGGAMVRSRLTMEASNDTFGFLTRFQFSGATGRGNADVGAHTAIGWWQPAPMFWLAIGFDDNGLFAAQGNSRWMFYRDAGDMVVDPSNAWGAGWGTYAYASAWDFGHSFYAGFVDAGLALTITPIPELSINVGLPFIAGATIPAGPLPDDPWWFPGGTSHEIGDIFSSLHVQAAFAQPWGQVALTYRGVAQDYNIGSIFAYLNLRMIDNLDLDIGLGFHLRGEDHPDDTRIAIGLAAQFDVNADFGLRTRFQFGLDTADYIAFNGILFDLLPFFSLSDSITVFCSVGIAVDMVSEGPSGVPESASAFNWHLNPYVEIGGDWAPRFFAGFRLWSTNGFDDNGHVNWAVPIGLTINF